MSSKDLAIRVTDLSKCYNIYSKPIDRLKQSVVPRMVKFLGKPVPTYYREFWALRNLKLDVEKGETIGVIGRNGSGKSTLLQLVCGTLTPTNGMIETKGRITALLELGSGFNPEFTGRENVFLNGAILGLNQEEIEAHFDAIADFADIGEFIEQPVKFYSSGMIVRLAFAVQAMVDPDILIVDEALAVGDEMFQRKCFRRLDELKKAGTSILFVSHSGQQIIELCDHALLLEQGQRLLLADPLSVVRAYQKLIYAKTADQTRLIQEFKALDYDGENKHEMSRSNSLNEYIFPNTEGKEKIPETDFFESSLIPQTTEFFPVQGARINSIKIYNDNGREVNSLLAGREYRLEIRGEFLQDFDAINLGILIRTKTGLPITILYHPGPRRYITNVRAKQRFCLIHNLKMNLLPETYFVTASLWSASEQIPLHRVVDMIMFRVLPMTEDRVSGYVDLTSGEPEFEILDER